MIENALVFLASFLNRKNKQHNNHFKFMKTTSFTLLLLVSLLINSFTFANPLSGNPDPKPIYLTNSKYRVEPLDLHNRILSKKNVPIILNVSSERHTPIKGSIHIGNMEDHTFADLKAALGNTPKTKEIVVYCGCCSLDNCERVEKAFNLLRANGYTNVKVLNLYEGFLPDWKGKNYITENYEI